MKRLLIMLVVSFFLSGVSYAQMGDMLVRRNDKGLYIEHKVVAKEGLFSIGRIYAVHPHHLATFNGLDANKGLNLGQVLKIPLTDTNFNQRSDDGLALYYEVAAGDGLSAISRTHNRVPVERLREWNNLRTDNINKGTKLIVGYLSTTTPPPVAVSKTEPATEEARPAVDRAVEVVKETPKEQPVAQVKQEQAPARVEPEKPAEVKTQPVQPSIGLQTGGGFFRPFFEEQTKTNPAKKNMTVTSGVFKTTSGWDDTKYYILMDNVATGSIVKVTNPNNNRIIFAKVLGQMNGIRQNQGLDIRLSNAGAAALGINDQEKFVVTVNF